MVKHKGVRTYYESLPDNCKVANIDMFFENGKPILWMPFLIESISGDQFHALRVGSYFTNFIKDDFFRVQLIRKKVYVFTSKSGEIRQS